MLVLRTAGRAAFARARFLYLAIAMVSMIVFAPNAMMASDVTDLAQSSIGFRIVLWSVWLLAATPAARAVLCEPSLFWWRSLPIPRLFFYVAQDLCSRLPSCRLRFCIRARRTPAGWHRGCSVNMSLHSCGFPRSRDLPSWIVLFGLPLAVCLPLPLPVLLPLSLLCGFGLCRGRFWRLRITCWSRTDRRSWSGAAGAGAYVSCDPLARPCGAVCARVLALLCGALISPFGAAQQPDHLCIAAKHDIARCLVPRRCFLVCLGWPVRLCAVHSMPIGCSRSVSATEGFACWRRSVRFRSAA